MFNGEWYKQKIDMQVHHYPLHQYIMAKVRIGNDPAFASNHERIFNRYMEGALPSHEEI